jgi:hypothetical protein
VLPSPHYCPCCCWLPLRQQQPQLLQLLLHCLGTLGCLLLQQLLPLLMRCQSTSDQVLLLCRLQQYHHPRVKPMKGNEADSQLRCWHGQAAHLLLLLLLLLVL